MGADAQEVIDDINREAEAKRFFKEIINYFEFTPEIVVTLVSSLSDVETEALWYEYIGKSPLFLLRDDIWNGKERGVEGKVELVLSTTVNNRIIIIKNQVLKDLEKSRLERLSYSYEFYKNLNKENREKVLKSLI